jgi:hypothetical protein
MSTTTNGTTWDAKFWTLILADEDLARAEFDALIAAEWPDGASANRCTRVRRYARLRRDRSSSWREACVSLDAADRAALADRTRERGPPPSVQVRRLTGRWW